MEKQVFLDRVRETLLQNGLSEELAARQIDKLSRYIDEEGGKDTEVMLDEEDPVLLAEEICTILKRNAARRAAAAAVAVEEDEGATVSVPTPAPAPAAVQPVQMPAETGAVILTDLPGTDRAVTPDGTDYANPEEIYVPPVDMGAFDDVPQTGKSKKAAKRAKREMLEVDEVGSKAVEYAGEPGGALFWVMFAVALPFAIALCLLVLALFVAAFAALAVLQIGAFAALIAVAAAGTAFTLVALIYGIVQALSTLPVGLFEIGIGVTAGAVVLFCSILLYNFAIRLLPFAMKQLGRFLGWTVRRGKMLFIYLKGACAKL